MRTLIVTAVEAEAEAVRAGLTGTADVHAVGVGIASAAAGTAALLATGRYTLVISAGIAGGFAGRAAIGDVVVATHAVAAEFGADSPDGFVPIDALGFGSAVFPAGPLGAAGTRGQILSVQMVTGTAAGAGELLRRYPDAVAEAMEGFGVATAAARAGVAFAELRTISNLVGPRERAGWKLPEALAALTAACSELEL